MSRPLITAETLCSGAVMASLSVLIGLSGNAFGAVTFFAGATALFVLRALSRNTMSWFRPSVTGAFIAAYVAMMAVPAALLAPELLPEVGNRYLLAAHSVLGTFALGVALGSIPRRSRPVMSQAARTEQQFKQDARLWRLITISILPSVLVVATYLALASQVQLIAVFANDVTANDGAALRFAANDLPRFLHFAFEAVRRVVIPIVVTYLYMMKLSRGGRWTAKFSIAFVVGMAVMLLTLDRAPVVALIAMLAAAHLFGVGVHARDKYRPWLPVALVAISMLAAGIVSVFQYVSVFSWQVALQNSWYVFSYRLLQDPAYMTSLAFERYGPGSGSFLGGRYVRLLVPFTGVYVHSTAAGFEELVDPVSFVGDLWRNWGWPGVLVGPVLLGIVLSKLDSLLRDRSGPAASTLRVVAMAQAVWFIPGQFLGIMSTTGFVATFAVVWWTMRSGNIRLLAPPHGNYPRLKTLSKVDAQVYRMFE